MKEELIRKKKGEDGADTRRRPMVRATFANWRKKMRYTIVILLALLCPPTPANAQVTVGIGLPNVSIGVNVPVYPQLVRVPGYPVYYAPGVETNYFFYDGMYWVCQGDNWYASSWYNGPWALVAPDSVPVYILRVPVRYYRHPPVYFYGWNSDAPPRWGEHWGASWQRQHGGWDRWNHQTSPSPAPLPVYQEQYSGNRYPSAAQQQTLHGQNYRYVPHDAAVKQAYQAQGLHGGQGPSQPVGKDAHLAKSAQQHDAQRTTPPSAHATAPTPKGQPAKSVPQHDVQRTNPPSAHATASTPKAQPMPSAQQHEARPATPSSAHAMAPTPQGQPARAPEHNEAHQGKGGPEPKGNAGEPKGEERGAEHK